MIKAPPFFSIVLGLLTPAWVWAHGIVGDRYFPPTITVDDPFVATEAHAVVGRTPNLDVDKTSAVSGKTAMLGASAEITDGFGISIDTTYRAPNGNLENPGDGFDRFYYRVKKEVFTDSAREFQFTLGLTGQLGNTGSKGSGSDSTYAPSIFFAKGFGDLSQELWFLRPFALTGLVGYQLPSVGNAPRVINLGLTVQYSLTYLNNHVQPTGWNNFLNQLVVIVEMPMQACLDHACANQTSRSINPGVIWVGRHFNIAAELVMPNNANSGKGTGVLVQMQRFFGR